MFRHKMQKCILKQPGKFCRKIFFSHQPDKKFLCSVYLLSCTLTLYGVLMAFILCYFKKNGFQVTIGYPALINI